MKDTLMLGAAGVAAIYIARRIPAIRVPMEQFSDNGKTVPIIPSDFGKNPKTPTWSILFTLIPAAGAYYLSR